MKWLLTHLVTVIKVGIVAFRLVEAAKADGVITFAEMVEGVTALVEAAGLADQIRIETEPPEGLSA